MPFIYLPETKKILKYFSETDNNNKKANVINLRRLKNEFLSSGIKN